MREMYLEMPTGISILLCCLFGFWQFSQYGTHHSYVLVVHTLRVAENEILKLDLPAKRH
jgi:hypothetical protein